ncbi:MAG: DUF1552 domain-containing protein [Nannocystales bacterium]
MSRTKSSRRRFLRGAAGTVLGLPMLELMLDSHGEALADGGELPCRYFLSQSPTALVVSGSTEEGLTPTQPGFDYDVRPVLQPLLDHGIKDEVSVISGLFVAPLDVPGGYNVDYHGQATFALLTGLRSGFSGTTWRPQGLSPDQLVAAAIGRQTVHPYLYYQLDSQPEGHKLCYEETKGFEGEDPIVFRGITPQVSPALAYLSLFTNFQPPDAEPDPTAELERRLRVSSLSYAGDQISMLQNELGAADRQLMDQHLTRVRELEMRLLADTVPTGEGCADPMLPADDPADLGQDLPDQDARAALFVDLIQMAFACDMTRVMTLGGASALTGTGMRHEQWNHVGGLHGEVQHASPQAELDAANRWFVDVYARVLASFAEIPEGAGTMLDNVAAMYMMEGGKGLSADPMRSGDGGGDSNHSVDNAVMMLAGRSGGLVPGQHLDLSGQDLHPAMVMNTAMRAVGVNENLGEIEGTLDALFEDA